jgi:hypothetical protein
MPTISKLETGNKMLTPEKLKRDLDLILRKLTDQGFDTCTLIFGPPATEDDLRSLEHDLGKPLPQKPSRHVANGFQPC